MYNREQFQIFMAAQQQLSPLQKAAQGAGELFSRARTKAESFFDRNAEVIYGFPIHQQRLTRYFTPELFEYLPNPLNIDLYELAQGLVEQGRQSGYTVYDRAKDSHLREHGKVGIRTGHANDFAKPGFLKYDERAVAITGSDVMVSAVLGAVDNFGEAFTHFRYNEEEVPLFREDGTRMLLPELFSMLPNPLPPGSVVRFSNLRYNLEATILPIPNDLPIPQASLLGAAERNSLNTVFKETQEKGGKILVVYKKSHEGLAQGFVQAEPGFDVYELVDADKKRVKKKNGRRTSNHAVPRPRPGITQAILMPVEGGIESLVREETDKIRAGFPLFDGSVAAFGIDIVETGSSASRLSVVPINFRDDATNHTPGRKILRAFEKDHAAYLGYVRKNSIMPVQPIAVSVKRRRR